LYQLGAGGALFVIASGTITNCIFTNNNAMYNNGGAINVINSAFSTSITNCNFTNNVAASGGAIYTASKINIMDSTFTNNSAAASSGGGLYCSLSGNITDSSFTNNTGGGAYISSNAIIKCCTFTNGAFTGTDALITCSSSQPTSSSHHEKSSHEKSSSYHGKSSSYHGKSSSHNEKSSHGESSSHHEKSFSSLHTPSILKALVFSIALSVILLIEFIH